jgi:tetratricopeptide (TPR) repeat protein
MTNYDFDWKGAAEQVEAARRADPGITPPIALAFISGCNNGHCYDQVIEVMSREIERDPLNASAYRTRGWERYCAGQLEAAESDERRTLELSPSIAAAHHVLAIILVARHELADALSEAEADVGLYRAAGVALAYGARWVAARGDTASALDWLERAYRQHDSGLVWAIGDPLLRPLVREPRFIALRQKLGLST